MIRKHLTLKAHCGSCLSLIFKASMFIDIKKIESLSKANNAIEDHFPKDIKCKACEIQKIERSYFYYHEHKFETPKPTATQKQLDRIKAQIAATYDDNSNISLKERLELRQVLQAQFQQIKNVNTMNLN